MRAKEMLEKVKAAKEVTISDISNYEWERSRNGGAYSYTTTYTFSKGKWWAYESTSCELVEDEPPYPTSLRQVWHDLRSTLSRSPNDWDVWIGNEQVKIEDFLFS